MLVTDHELNNAMWSSALAKLDAFNLAGMLSMAASKRTDCRSLAYLAVGHGRVGFAFVVPFDGSWRIGEISAATCDADAARVDLGRVMRLAAPQGLVVSLPVEKPDPMTQAAGLAALSWTKDCRKPCSIVTCEQVADIEADMPDSDGARQHVPAEARALEAAAFRLAWASVWAYSRAGQKLAGEVVPDLSGIARKHGDPLRYYASAAERKAAMC